MGGFRGGPRGPRPPFFAGFVIYVFRVDIHVLLEWSAITLSPNFFGPVFSIFRIRPRALLKVAELTWSF